MVLLLFWLIFSEFRDRLSASEEHLLKMLAGQLVDGIAIDVGERHHQLLRQHLHLFQLLLLSVKRRLLLVDDRHRRRVLHVDVQIFLAEMRRKDLSRFGERLSEFGLEGQGLDLGLGVVLHQLGQLFGQLDVVVEQIHDVSLLLGILLEKTGVITRLL